MKKIVFFLFLVIVLAGGIFFVNLSGFNNTAEAEEWTYIYIKSDAVPGHPYTVSIGGTDTHFDTIEAALNYAHGEFLINTSTIVFDNTVISPPETGIILPNAVYSGGVRFEGSSPVGFIIENSDINPTTIDAKFQNLTITTYARRTVLHVRNDGYLYAADLNIKIGDSNYSLTVNNSVFVKVEHNSVLECVGGSIIIFGSDNSMGIYGQAYIDRMNIDILCYNNTLFYVEDGYLDVSNSSITTATDGNNILNNQFYGRAIFTDTEITNIGEGINDGAFFNAAGCSLEVNGGYIYMTFALENQGDATINNCEFWRKGIASHDHLIYNSGDLEITGGVYCNGDGNTILNVYGGSLYIYEEDKDTYPTYISGKTSAIRCENSGTVYFYGGTIEMTEDAAVAVIVDDGEFYGISGEIISTYECINIGENGYVRLEGDCYLQAKGTGNRAVNVSGTLEVIDQAEIVTTGGTGILVNAGGNLKIEAEPEESEYTVNAIGEGEDGSICIDNRGFADIRSGRLTTGNKGILNTGDGELYIYNIDIESTSDFGGNAGAEGDYVLKNESYAEIYGGYFYASRAGIPCVKNYGNLSIVEDEETLSISAVGVGIYNASTATGPAYLIFEGGSVYVSGDEADSAAILNEGNLDISGGYINHSGQYGICIKNIDSPFGDPGTVSISGGATIECGGEGDYEAESYTIVNEATSDYDFVSASGRGYISIWDGNILNDSPEGVAIWTKSGALTFVEGSETQISAVQNTAVLNEGEFMLYGGEIEGRKFAIENRDTLRIYGGTVYAFMCAVMNSGLCNIKGGTVQSDICAIDNYEEMYIFGSEATVRIIGEEDGSVAIANSGHLISISSGTVINEGTGINRRTIVNYDGAIVRISESGEVSIINDDIDNTSYCVLNEAGGEFWVEGGTLSATGAYTPLIINQKLGANSGLVTISNGSLTAECYLIYNSGDVTIWAGAFTCDTPGQTAIINLGVMTIKGGTFEAIQSCISNTGELEIQSGSFSAVDNAVHTSGSSYLEVSGGTFATSGDDSSVIIADQYSENSVYITGGTYSSTGSGYTIIKNIGAATITLVCAVDISEADTAADTVIYNEAGTVIIGGNIKVNNGTGINNISGTVTLDNSFVVLESGGAGTVIRNTGTFQMYSGVLFANDTSVAIVNGGTAKLVGQIIVQAVEGAAIENSGNLIIDGYAQIYSYASATIGNTGAGNINIGTESVGSRYIIIYNYDKDGKVINSASAGTVTLLRGEINAQGNGNSYGIYMTAGDLVMGGGNIYCWGSNGRAIYCQSEGTLTISGGEITTCSQGAEDRSAIYMSAGAFNMNGGYVNCTGRNGKGVDISGGAFTMSGGTVEASGLGNSIGINVTGGSFNMMEGEVISRGDGTGSYVICGGNSASISLNQDENPITLTGNRPIYVNSGSKTMLSGITIVSGEYAVKCIGAGGIDMLNCEFDMDQNTVLTYAVICSGEATLNACAIFSDKGGIYSDGTLLLTDVTINAGTVGVEIQGEGGLCILESVIYADQCGIYANTEGPITIGDHESTVRSTISVTGHTSDLADIGAGIGGRAFLNLKENVVKIHFTDLTLFVNEANSQGAVIDMKWGQLTLSDSTVITAYVTAAGATVSGIYLDGNSHMYLSTGTQINDGTVITSDGVGIAKAGNSHFEFLSGKIIAMGSCFVINGTGETNQIKGGQFTTLGANSACAQIISGILLVAQNSGAVFSNNSETATILSGTNSTVAFYSGEFRNAGSDLILELTSGRTEESVNQLISPDVHLYLNVSVDKYLVLGKYDSGIGKYVLNSSTKSECKIEARINDKYTFNKWVEEDGTLIGTDPTVTIGNNVYFKVKSVIKVSFSLLPTASVITYGDTLDTNVLSFWAVIDANSKPVSGSMAFVMADEILPAGQHIVEVYFTPDDADTYDMVACEVSITINPRPITVTALDKTKTYGDGDPGLDYTVDRLVGGDTLNGALIRDAGETAGEYDILNDGITNEDNPNYIITFVPGTFTIETRPLYVYFKDNSKLYGDGDPGIELDHIENYAFDDDLEPENPAGKREPGASVGVYIYSAEGAPVNTNYHFAVPAEGGGALTINKRPLKITLANCSKTYGDPDPAFGYELHDVDGVGGWIEGDIFDTTQISRVSGEAVGEYDINCYDINSNYDITVEKGKLTITKKQLTISAKNSSKVYGDYDPPLAYEISGFAFSEYYLHIGGVTPIRAPGKNVGEYTITISCQEKSSNYTYTYVYAVFTILPRPITISAYDAGKIYRDADPASFNYTIEEGNLVGSDTLSGSLMREPGEDAGGYRIYTETLNNANNPNYDITFNEGTFTIDKRALTLKIDDKSRLYGDPDPTPAYEISGYLGGDEPQEPDAPVITRTAGETVGTYQYFTESNPSNGNYRYQLSVDSGALTINPRPLTVTLADASKIYGDADPDFGYQLQAYETGVGGWVSGDVFDPSEIWKEDGEDVGEHDIDCGYQNGNYIITVIKGKLTITERQLTITAKDGAKVYGSSDPVLEYEITGLAFLDNGETIGGVTVSREPGENAGTYAIVVSSAEASSNYTYTYNQGVFTINPKPVTVTVDNVAKVYGDSDPDGFTYSVEGLVGDDTLTGNLSREPGENAGSYVITGVLSNDNYDVTMIDGAFTITKRPINVAAENKSKYYGAEDPELTFTHDDLVGNDETTGNLARLVGENVGKYAITIGTVTAGDNYEINFTAGELTILNNVGCDITSLKVNQADAEIDGLNITASTLHTVTYGGITLGTSPYSTFKVYSDSACTEEVSKDGLSLNLGANTVYIKVTAQDGATNKVYTLTVTRVPSNDSALSPAKDGIAADNNTFTITKYKGKTFDFSGNFAVPETAAYKIYTDPDFTNEFAGDSLTLKNGKNTYYIRVTAQDNTTSDYVLTIEKVSNTWVYILLGSVFGTAGIAVGTILLLKKFKIIPKQQKPKQQPKPKQK